MGRRDGSLVAHSWSQKPLSVINSNYELCSVDLERVFTRFALPRVTLNMNSSRVRSFIGTPNQKGHRL